MGHLSIHCENCRNDWIVYHRDNWKDGKHLICPTCGKSIPIGLWAIHVLRAFNEMEDAQIELIKAKEQGESSLFEISYIPDIPKQEDLSEKIEEMNEELERMKEELREFKNMFLGGD